MTAATLRESFCGAPRPVGHDARHCVAGRRGAGVRHALETDHQSDTRTAIERAEEVVRSGRTRDLTTVERMWELLADHADLEGLLALDED
ncbi:hypothetical protein BRC83_07550 [Halobacteriales archaeon QS_1_68_17]|nr:MAG: hypothetical protein BRC83_07550 [Halobacteriales archaeon QS_1_68_17]